MTAFHVSDAARIKLDIVEMNKATFVWQRKRKIADSCFSKFFSKAPYHTEWLLLLSAHDPLVSLKQQILHHVNSALCTSNKTTETRGRSVSRNHTWMRSQILTSFGKPFHMLLAYSRVLAQTVDAILCSVQSASTKLWWSEANYLKYYPWHPS